MSGPANGGGGLSAMNRPTLADDVDSLRTMASQPFDARPIRRCTSSVRALFLFLATFTWLGNADEQRS